MSVVQYEEFCTEYRRAHPCSHSYKKHYLYCRPPRLDVLLARGPFSYYIDRVEIDWDTLIAQQKARFE